MKTLKAVAVTLAALCATLGVQPARAACQIKQYAELPVTVIGQRILVDAQINGKPVKLIADTGAFASTIFGPAARALGLADPTFSYSHVGGIGGDTGAVTTSARSLSFGSYTVRNPKLVVAMNVRDFDGAAGLLGRDLFASYDVEFDLGHKVIRLLEPSGSCNDDQMAYWGSAYSQAPLDSTAADQEEFRTTVRLNGRPVIAELDSGSGLTLVTTGGAGAAGVFQRDFRSAGETGGLGAGGVDTYEAKFASVDIGGEVVHDADLMVGDLFHYNRTMKTGSLLTVPEGDFPAMLLGADFLKANRVLLSRSHQKMYFSYLGGPVLLSPELRRQMAVAARPAVAPAPPAPASAPRAVQPSGPTSAGH